MTSQKRDVFMDIWDFSGLVKTYDNSPRDIDIIKRFARNEIEKKRRSDLKETFDKLRDHIPSLSNVSHASKVMIVKTAIELITTLTQKNEARKAFIDKLRRQNALVARQIKELESNKRRTSVIKIECLDSEGSQSGNDQNSGEESDGEGKFVDVC